MGSNETNLHRAARALQRAEGISYQQARQRILDARAGIRRPVPESPLRRHLRELHAVEAFADDATEETLAEFHRWDHETGELGVAHTHGPGDPLASTLDDPAVAGPRLDLSGAHIAGVGTIVETAVGGNPNLIRVAHDNGTEIVLDLRRFARSGGGLADDVAAALIADARTTEAGDLELLVALATEVVIVRAADRWLLHCTTDADHANVAWVDGRVSADQLRRWLEDRGATVVDAQPDAGTYDDPAECVAAGTHLADCDDDGYCNACGHQDSVEQIERNGRDDLCEDCRDVDHGTCGLDPNCACCRDTITQLGH